ncbi:putative vesicular fusion protein nsf [Trypanosoma vivax]|uniref:Vesicle-fusing ATPase n=1 Tax=Trypanosoma vivax (strain Y486) TaxID=1055687 RepID=G0TR58_TRYVY|nr:putative vesicular-fusion protein nsf [Trypanosoma vivax]KAH8611322.1 putative vesicular fusion protein nsf [Trypanosoma vivax]CCC46422.1 putative vesicular-fusion protein nsf [Trypanosoma vivax Y486]
MKTDSKSMTLRVCAVLTDADSFTNCIYLDQEERVEGFKDGNMVMVQGFPFMIKKAYGIGKGNVGMNGIQRRLLNVSIALGATVKLVSCTGDPPDIDKIVLALEGLTMSKKSGSVDYVEFTTFFREQFRGQWFKQGQMLAVVNKNMRFTAHVAELNRPGKDEIGALKDSTVITLVSRADNEITVTNVPDDQLDAQQAQLMMDFNLENLGIGGLRSEFGQVFRRAFASRLFPQSFMKKLGVKHVKGVLLYGPPGTGKTLIARKIGEILRCHPPKIVNGPEVFDKYVGGTEENVRKLFVDAEAEAAAKGDQSQLHLIIFDEFDAICKQRGSSRDSTGVNDNVVNQLLSKIDGVNSLTNVLLIGMTNRIDLIDEAILRPGRFEVHVEIGLPNEEGRQEILRIHTRGMNENGVLSKDVDIPRLAALTKNYSGAEIEGVVRSASSNAFNRHIDLENPSATIDTKNVVVKQEDFLAAISELKPAFGQAKEECDGLKRGGIIKYGSEWAEVEKHCGLCIDQLRSEGKRISSLTVLLEGLPGCGKSAVAAHLADKAEFPYVRVISSENMVGYGEAQKVNIIRKAFDDAVKSPASTVILDDLERIIEFSSFGGRYSNAILQALLVLTKRPPPEGRRLLVIATTSLYDMMDRLELAACFSVKLNIPSVTPEGVECVAKEMGIEISTGMLRRSEMPQALPIKQAMLVLEMAADQKDGKLVVTDESLARVLRSTRTPVARDWT